MKICTEQIKRFARLHAKSKKGTTLIELVATIAILGIVSSISLGALYSMADIAKAGQKVSVSQRVCTLFSKQLSLYGRNASNIDFYSTMPSSEKYDEHSNPNGFMNKDQSCGDKIDYFIAAGSAENSIDFLMFDSSVTPCRYKVITTVDKIKSIEFTVKRLNLPDYSIKKYMLSYSITTTENYEISGGVILNNTSNASLLAGHTTSISSDATNADHDNVLKIRSTSRKESIRY